MWQQILAIAWAQFRITRNHLPRTTFGGVLMWIISLFWYAVYAALGVVLAVRLPDVAVPQLRLWTPVGLFGVFLFWQVVPLFTLSTGWSLQLNKLRVFPVRDSSLFGIEVLLRLTSAPEMLLILAGALIGFWRHPAIPLFAPLFLLLYIPFNLFLQLAIRDLILYSFERNRFRELFATLIISISILPQFLTRTRFGHLLRPYFFATAHGSAAPWREAGSLSLGFFSVFDLLLLLVWTFAAYALGRWQFARSLRHEETIRSSGPGLVTKQANEIRLLDWPAKAFRDPLAALLQKEFRSLLRMPRFRVLFGMACIFSVVVFVPVTFNQEIRNPGGFISSNFLPIVNLYGLLLLSDVLLLNIFGLDRRAAQLYFVVPVPFETVVKAKNLAAVAFVLLQTLAVLLIALLIRAAVTPFSAFSGAAASAVVTIYLLAAGNFASVSMARPVDPSQTFKKQGGARMQLWLLLCGVGMYALVGFAFLARWALHNSDWALISILGLEFAIGLIVYRLATESAIARGLRDRERLVEALSKGASPVSAG